jgi:hypothetical protein
MKKMKIIHWIVTGLLSAMLLMSASLYITNHEIMAAAFLSFGFPSWLLYPLAVAKILGVLAVLTKFNSTLTEMAYAGFLFNFLLAIGAHVHAEDGSEMSAVVALLFLVGSYVTWKLGWKKVVLS